MVRALFLVEKQAAELSVAQRPDLRQSQSVPVLADPRQKLLSRKEQLLPNTPLAEAVNTSAPMAVPIDNNISEREMKRVVLNRKNSLFVGNPRGGRTAAILAAA